MFTYRLLYSWNEPPSSNRIFANRTAFKNGTSTNSSRFSSTENLYFFFFIMNAIPGAPGPINVIHTIVFSFLKQRKKSREIRYLSLFHLLSFVFFKFNFTILEMYRHFSPYFQLWNLVCKISILSHQIHYLVKLGFFHVINTIQTFRRMLRFFFSSVRSFRSNC